MDSTNHDQNENCEISHSDHQRYLTIEQVFNLYPLKSIKKVSIYGIIQSFDSKTKTLTLMDENRKYFHIATNVMSDPDNPAAERVPMRTGNIIRITNLHLNVDFTRRCYDPKNLVTFESFRNEQFIPIHLGGPREFTDTDRIRVKELIRYNFNYISESEVRPTRMSTHFVVDVGFQILCTLKTENRVILACYNGKHFIEYPCMQLIKLQQIIDTLRDTGKYNCYSEDFLRKKYEEGKIVFVSVYGLHRATALILKPLDMVVLYNLLIKIDKFYFGKYSFIINDGYNYGRCIRIIEEGSELARILESKIEENCLLNLSIRSRLDQSASQIYDTPEVDTENREIKRPKLEMRSPSMLMANTLNESTLNTIPDLEKVPCPHFQYNLSERKLIYRHFYSNRDKSIPNAIRCKMFADIVEQADSESGQVFQIKAQFHSLVLEDLFKSMSNLRRYGTVVLCTSSSPVRTCPYRESFEKFMEQSKDWYREVDGRLVMVDNDKTNIPLDRLRCPCCSLETCILCLDFTVLLKDYDGGLMLVRWTNLEANLFFSCSTSELCQKEGDDPSSNVLKSILAVFQHMSHITNDQTECNVKLTWTLVAENIFDSDRQEFHLVDVSVLNKSKACGIQSYYSLW